MNEPLSNDELAHMDGRGLSWTQQGRLVAQASEANALRARAAALEGTLHDLLEYHPFNSFAGAVAVLRAILDANYPPDIFQGGDLGSELVAEARKLVERMKRIAEAEADRDDLLEAMRDSLSIECRKPCLDALAKYKESKE